MLDKAGREKRGKSQVSAQAAGLVELWAAQSGDLVPNKDQQQHIQQTIAAGAAKIDSGEYAAAIQVPLHAGKWTTWNAPATNITLRLIPDLHCDLVWMVNNDNMEMIATKKNNSTSSAAFALHKNDGSISWKITSVDETYQQTLDYAIIEEWVYYKGIAFIANPFTSPYPWKAPANTHAEMVAFFSGLIWIRSSI
ncbi:hypothetical protein PHMEG_00018607 [Phytophthora megakarya]|uniref:Uncharacterized protein n=1 Tax=Phytophthora megakarya TaxID=4795 RepID=A0A225VTN0_9STRA|nr:hypothetical protein PHMEG_00018607 [Phytophthora megakarya]